MENSDIGESSCRRKPNIDKMSDSERPLKKAKFAWQVKGRYHLKDQEDVAENNVEENNTQISTAPNIVTVEQIDSITEGIEMTSKAEENLELLGDYLLRQQDFSIAPIINNTPSESSATEVKPVVIPREELSGSSSELVSAAVVPLESTSSEVEVPVKNYTYKGLAPSSSFKSFADDFKYTRPLPITMQPRPVKSEDQYLARWQARQIAKGFVDNTINRVLDSWLVAPLPTAYGDSQNIAIDVAEFFDNLPANNAVENEGILMAISAHGLQNNRSGSQSIDPRLQNRSFGSRICRIGLSEPNSQICDQNSPSSDLSTQYLFCTDVDENDHSLFPLCNGYLGNPSSFSQSTILPNNENESLSFNFTSDKDKSDSTKSCKSAESSDKCNEKPSSSEPSAWKHLTEPCNCSHTPRRTNITPNIPFHRRDNIDHLSNSVPIREETSPTEEEVSAGSSSIIEPKKEECLTDDKSSDDSANEEDCQSSNNQSSSSVYPMTEPSDQPFDETFDFMEAAVAFAIQNKGLTSFSSVDYG